MNVMLVLSELAEADAGDKGAAPYSPRNICGCCRSS
jgi:hypothetical protein